MISDKPIVKPIVEFLCRDENLSLALDVAGAIGEVDAKIEGVFLERVHFGLAEKFAMTNFATNWNLEKPDIYDVSKTRRYASICLSPSKPDSNAYLYYLITVSREGAELNLYYGLEWFGKIAEQPKEFPTTQSLDLIKFLDAHEFERNRWILAKKVFESFKSRKELILALHQRKAELAECAIRDFWSFVENTIDMVQITNDSLTQSNQKK